jgi:hypothetical protein
MLWSANLRRKGFPIVRHVNAVEALGIGRLEQVSYSTVAGNGGTLDAELLLIHEGVVPSMHFTQSMGCRHRWNDKQKCFEPELDLWGESSGGRVAFVGYMSQGTELESEVLRLHARVASLRRLGLQLPMAPSLRRMPTN